MVDDSTQRKAESRSRTVMAAAVLAFAVVATLPGEARAQATAKPEYIYNQQEGEAAEVVKSWIDAWATKDPQKVAQYMAESCIFRGDPSQKLQSGRAAFVTEISRLIRMFDSMKIDELFVTGTEWGRRSSSSEPIRSVRARAVRSPGEPFRSRPSFG